MSSVNFSPDDTKIVSGSDDKNIIIWDTTTGSIEQTLTGHTDYVRSVNFSPDGTKIVSERKRRKRTDYMLHKKATTSG